MSRRSRSRRMFRPSPAADDNMRARFEAEKQRHLALRREARGDDGDPADEAAGAPAPAGVFGGAGSNAPAPATVGVPDTITRGEDAPPAGLVEDSPGGPAAEDVRAEPGADAPSSPADDAGRSQDAHSRGASGASRTPDGTAVRPRRINIAIVAMGGQGGGVLSDWFVTLAETSGWRVQATSVPGVAQRTGATIYYLEMFEGVAGAEPVLAMMPLSGDVDLVVAAEWMEAGRAITRGLVTPDRTTLVASTHRAYATAEKIVPGNGMADGEVVREAATRAAARLLAFDMAELAEDNGSVISASLFGAVAASGALPFPLEAFEAAVRAGGVGVESSLAALRAAHERGQAELGAAAVAEDSAAQGNASDPGETADAVTAAATDVGQIPDRAAAAGAVPKASEPVGTAVVLPTGEFGQRIGRLPGAARATALEGVRRCVDYLDADYAREYLERLEVTLGLATNARDGDPAGAQGAAGKDAAPAGESEADELAYELARWLALRMCYEDPIRVADLKVRRERFGEIRREVRAARDQLIEQDEFLHPRLEEVLDTIPEAWADRLENWPLLRRFVAARFSGGRILRTTRLTGFLPMAWLAGRREWRRRSRRHAREMAHIEAWLGQVRAARGSNPPLAPAVARMARLIKGYSDTQERSLSTYARISEHVDSLMPRPDGGAILDYLIEAALSDADGRQLEAALAELARIGAAPVRERLEQSA